MQELCMGHNFIFYFLFFVKVVWMTILFRAIFVLKLIFNVLVGSLHEDVGEGS